MWTFLIFFSFTFFFQWQSADRHSYSELFFLNTSNDRHYISIMFFYFLFYSSWIGDGQTAATKYIILLLNVYSGGPLTVANDIFPFFIFLPKFYLKNGGELAYFF